MIELAWFVAGLVVALVALRPWRRRRQPANPAAVAPVPPPAAAATTTPAPRPLQPPGVAVESRHLASSLADELANLASGVEGRAHQLIEAAANRAALPQAAEGLLVAVQRLRTLHNKLAAFGHVARSPRGTTITCLAELIGQLREELQTLQLGLELRWEPPQHLPAVAIDPDVAHDALLFLCSAMLRAERGATHLSIASETCFAGAVPRVQIELVLEWITEGHAQSLELLDDATFTLDLEAANQLVVANEGELTIHHLPGRSVRAVVRWPLGVHEPEAARSVTGPAPTDGTPAIDARHALADHHYGGALVLESDPSIRAMLASELKATGRAVFACADATSARTFLEATPDRFELLIVDHPQRLDGDDALAATIRALAPGLKIFVLAAGQRGASEQWPQLHHIQKPFGVHELRRALASVLAAG